ncbi:hypothetical protein V8E51_008531 [Hyaloscypha variabilis]
MAFSRTWDCSLGQTPIKVLLLVLCNSSHAFDQVVLMWCVVQRARRRDARVHDKHEEHSIWCHITMRQRTNNALTRMTTKTTRAKTTYVTAIDNLVCPTDLEKFR